VNEEAVARPGLQSQRKINKKIKIIIIRHVLIISLRCQVTKRQKELHFSVCVCVCVRILEDF
jgi:hypothetical protein